jgi:hypothetical protein
VVPPVKAGSRITVNRSRNYHQLPTTFWPIELIYLIYLARTHQTGSRAGYRHYVRVVTNLLFPTLSNKLPFSPRCASGTIMASPMIPLRKGW